MTASPVAKFFRSCEPNESISPSDDRYVNCDDVRGDNLMRFYERAIRRAGPDKPEIRLLSGHRGVGKSSELLRLQEMLRTNQPDSPGLMVVYVDVARVLDVNDLEFVDLLVFLAGEVQKQLRDAQVPGFTAPQKYFQRVWDDIRALLGSQVTLSGADIELPYVSLALELKNRPNARARLRQAIEAQTTNLLDAVNTMLVDAQKALVQSDRGGLALLVDGLDKVVLRPLDGGVNTHERLFCDRAEQLSSLRAHVVYTVPISLIYSSRCAQLEMCFGEFNTPIPMISLRAAGKGAVDPSTPGMQKMIQIVTARCSHAGVSIDDVFDSTDSLHYLCQMSGGHPRHLMMFLQGAVNSVDDFPITLDASRRAVRAYANALLREIPDDFWPKLRAFDVPADDVPKDEAHQEMLFLLHLFEYMNGQPWYEVNPVVRQLSRFSRS